MESNDYVQNLVEIVNTADRRIFIASEQLPEEYYGRSEVVDAITKAIGRGVSVCILTGPEHKSIPPHSDLTEIYITPYIPEVNFVVGVSKDNSLLSHLGFLPSHKHDVLLSSGEEGIGEVYRRKCDPVVGSYLLYRFTEATRKLKPSSLNPQALPH